MPSSSEALATLTPAGSAEDTTELAVSPHFTFQLRCHAEELAKSLVNLSSQVAVFGVEPHASIMFVGQAPGSTEDLKGEPFVGVQGNS